MSSFELWNLQYATLTDKAADDFATIPGLAESWEASDDGLTYTYTLREGLQWSDGEPLTAEDIAYTINTSRDQEWINHSATTVNLDATAIDDRTVQIVTSVPDPKLPTMDVYIVPKHIWEAPLGRRDRHLRRARRRRIRAVHAAGVEGRPVVDDGRQPQLLGGASRPIDQVVFRIFTNADAMVAALQEGEIDAAHLVPSASFEELERRPGHRSRRRPPGRVHRAGDERHGRRHRRRPPGAAGPQRPPRHRPRHRPRRDVRPRRPRARRARASRCRCRPIRCGSPTSPRTSSTPTTPTRRTRLLDEGGYLDTDGDGIREMPDGGRELVFRYAERSESEQGPAIREFVTGFLADIGIGTEVSRVRRHAS